MTRSEAEAIVSASRGKLCAQITRGADGTVITEEARPALHLISRRASPAAAAIVTAILGLGGSASAIVFPQAESSVSSPSEAGAKKPESQPRSEGGTASLSGHILDPQGAAVAGAKLVLVNTESAERHDAESSDEGRYEFASLKPGAYYLTAEAPGFAQAGEQIALSENQQKNLDVTVQAAVTLGGVVLLAPDLLRGLYFRSDLIVVASIGKSISLETQDHGGAVKTELHISSTIKGKSRKRVVYLHRWQAKDSENRFPEGESMLFFLAPHESARNGYVVHQEYHGIKKLSARDLSVYVDRMKELEVIGEATRENAKEVAEWLVRCAEDPATRWEGAYELVASARAAELKKEKARAAPGPESKKAATAPKDSEGDDELYFSEMLTGGQRERLMAALFNTDADGEGEYQLIELALIWRDERLAPYLVSQLRRVENDSPYNASRWARALGELFGDEDLNSLIEKYEESVALVSEYESELENAQEAEEQTEAEASPAAEPAQEDANRASGEAGIEQARRKRSAILAELLSAVEKKIDEMKSKARRD